MVYKASTSTIVATEAAGRVGCYVHISVSGMHLYASVE